MASGMDIKVCGLKTEEALAAAVAGGASHVGFIFFPKSPRHIAPAVAGRLRRLVKTVRVVAVTVDADDGALDEIVAAAAPDMLQLHGRESPARVAEVRSRYGLPAMKALSICEPADLDAIGRYRGVADRLLLDAKPPRGSELPGGNGIAFDWRLLAELDSAVDYLLSGGLNAGNIGAALAHVRPAGVDVSSGVESAPGLKDVRLIAEFFRAVRKAQESRAA